MQVRLSVTIDKGWFSGAAWRVRTIAAISPSVAECTVPRDLRVVLWTPGIQAVEVAMCDWRSYEASVKIVQRGRGRVWNDVLDGNGRVGES